MLKRGLKPVIPGGDNCRFSTFDLPPSSESEHILDLHYISSQSRLLKSKTFIHSLKLLQALARSCCPRSFPCAYHKVGHIAGSTHKHEVVQAASSTKPLEAHLEIVTPNLRSIFSGWRVTSRCQADVWQMVSGWLANGWRMASGWLANCWRVLSEWLAKGQQMASGWSVGGHRVVSACLAGDMRVVRGLSTG